MKTNTSLYLVRSVVEELKQTEQTLLLCGLNWQEEYKDVMVPKEYYNGEKGPIFVKTPQPYDLYRNNLGMPLKVINVSGLYQCGVFTIRLKNITSKFSVGEAIFRNNGEITFINKVDRGDDEYIRYEGTFNILDDELTFVTKTKEKGRKSLDVMTYQTDKQSERKYKRLNEIELITFTNGIEQKGFNSSKNGIKLDSKVSLNFSLVLNDDNTLDSGVIILSKKVRDNLSNCQFYIKNGQIDDIYSNVDDVYALLKYILKNINKMNLSSLEKKIVSSLTGFLYNYLFEKKYVFDKTPIDIMEKSIEKEMKTLKNDIPVYGLVTRIEEELKELKENRRSKQKCII